MAVKAGHIDDDLLGYLPRPGLTTPTTNVDGAGLRRCGTETVDAAGPPILAVGDSFTWGESVADHETWPAHLQAISGRRVLNGGVTGYGLDQIVLRAEILARVHKPADIVVGVIADDVWRTEMSRLWAYNKPWFRPAGDGLQLMGVPVRPWKPPFGLSLQWFESLCFRFPYPLQLAAGYHRRAQRAGLGPRVAERLVDRLAALQSTSGSRVTLLALSEQFPWDPRFSRAWINARRGLSQVVIDRARERGLALVDCHPAIDAQARPLELFENFHMTSAGNRLVAGLAAAALSP